MAEQLSFYLEPPTISQSSNQSIPEEPKSSNIIRESMGVKSSIKWGISTAGI